jgi:hypothetical protein
LKKKKRIYKDKLIDTLNEAFTQDPTTVWKTLHSLYESESPHQVNKYKMNPNKWMMHLQKLIGTNTEVDENIQQAFESELFDVISNYEESYLDFPITNEEINQASKSLGSKKSPGKDGLINEIIKASLPDTGNIIKKLFQKIFQSGIYPDEWKKGLNVPIHKSGDVTNPNNYRGITINNVLGNFFCQIINNRITNYLEENKLLAKEQAGFRKSYRTSDHIFVLKNIIEDLLKNRKSRLYCCFVDFQKAFDTVWHQGLMLKLARIGIKGNCFKIIKDMYLNATVCTRSQNGFSSDLFIRKGVLQGNKLSPTLFNIFINDLPNFVKGNGSPKIQDESISCLLYADDLILLSTIKSELQNKLNKLNTYCQIWGLNVNLEKTKVVIFSHTDPKIPILFSYGNKVIQTVDQYKYLGIIFHKCGKFTIAQEYLAKQANKAIHTLKRAIKGKTMKMNVILQLFDILIMPIATYGAEVWFPWTESNIDVSFTSTLDNFFENCISSKHPHEQIHLKFCKHLLGVHTKAMNLPTLAELGRYPLAITVTCHIASLWIHIIESDANSYLNVTYQKMIQEGDKNPWICYIKNMLCNLGMRHVWNNQATFSKNRLKHALAKQLESRYIKFWQQKKITYSKLEFYNKITNNNYNIEYYLLNINNIHHRQALSRLRISAHDLNIERGRYANIPRAERLCKVCHVLEDEVHFLDTCTIYNDLRFNLFQTLKRLDSTVIFWSQQKPSLLIQEDDKQQLLAEYIYECMLIR